MFKTYHKYIFKKFLDKFFKISVIFLSLILILNTLEEISFFKNIDENIYMPYFLTLIKAPMTIFEIFPFIFFLATQFFFYELFQKNEFELFKKSGLTNIKLIKILVTLVFAIGIFNIVVFYNLASNLKYHYSNIKNKFSIDNKYLAMVNNSGLWIKDEVDGKILITKAKQVDNNYILDVVINEFNEDFDLIKTIKSKKINVSANLWEIYDPVLIQNNIEIKHIKSIKINTNFNEKKISSIFSDISTLNLFKLYNLKKDYEKIGYSSNDIALQFIKLFSYPVTYVVFTIFAFILMINFNKNKSLLFNVVFGILLSVIIYYINFIFSSLGINGKIPIFISVFFPLIILSIISLIGLININEK